MGKAAGQDVEINAAAASLRQAAEEGLLLLRSDKSAGAKVSASGYKNVLVNPSAPPEKRFSVKDTRGLGSFGTAEEAALAYARSPEGRIIAAKRYAENEAVARALMQFDENGNGLDEEELTLALGAFGTSKSDRQRRNAAKEVFARCDSDGNGRLQAKVCPQMPEPCITPILRARTHTHKHPTTNTNKPHQTEGGGGVRESGASIPNSSIGADYGLEQQHCVSNH